MLQLIKTMTGRYNRYMTFLGRKRVCEVLLSNSDRMLEDQGFSRALLEKGVSAWPWLSAKSDRGLQPISFNASTSHAAIQELQSCSEAELHDLGITRGNIKEAVLHGRDGMDRNNDRKVA